MKLINKPVLFAAASGASALAAAATFALSGPSTVPFKVDLTPRTDKESVQKFELPQVGNTIGGRAVLKPGAKRSTSLSIPGISVGRETGVTSQPSSERQGVLGEAANSMTVAMTLTPTSNVVSLSDMAIGDSTSGELLVHNTGNLPATYSITGALGAGSSALLAGQLELTVYKIDGGNQTITKVWPPNPTANSSLTSFNSSAVSLGRLERPCQENPGKACDSQGRPMARRFQSRMTLRFEIELASRGTNALDNAMQALNAEEIFKFTAVEAAGA
jgi:hypothetical protein